MNDTATPAFIPTRPRHHNNISDLHGSEFSSSDSLPLFVGLPVIILIFIIIILLLLLLAWLSLRVRAKNSRYQSLPTEDGGPAGRLPYPPAVKLGEPPTPAMSFHVATQLSDPATTGARYPFIQHRSQAQMSVYEKRPPRLRTRRKGNHKHGKGMHALINGVERDPEVVEEEKAKLKEKRSSSVVSLSGMGGEYKYMLPVTKTMQASGGGKDPEIFLTLVYNKDTLTLVVRIERVVGLPFREDGSEVDAYVRLIFIPKLPELPQRRTSKTRTARRDSAPVFDEEIRYEAMSDEELMNSTLHMQVLDYKSYGKHAILGQADLLLSQVQFVDGEASISRTLNPPRPRENLGTILLSLSYNPESKKLSVIILRAKDLSKGGAKDIDAQAKILVGIGDKILGKLKTKRKHQSASPIFNEALTCSVEHDSIRNVNICVQMTNEHRNAVKREVGQVVLGAQTTGEEFRHWNDIMATPGKHIAEWHELR